MGPNRERRVDENSLVNGRNLTNVGTFRTYVEAYLRNHPQIHQNMTFLVRQLEPTEHGLPIQIYVFTRFVARRRKCLEMQGLRPRLTQAYSQYVEEVDGSATQQIQAIAALQ